MKTLIVIPARMASKRLPGKPLLEAGGQALVHWTYAQAKRVEDAHVVVATPDREIGRYCLDNGLTWMPTAEHHLNGTSRCWEILERSRKDFGRVVNWQCDEPCIRPEWVEALTHELFLQEAEIGTLVTPPLSNDDPCLDDRNLTKVVCSFRRCYWFSRVPMALACGHVGVYAFLPGTLMRIAQLPASQHAEAEKLEQLTWLEHGCVIKPFTVPELPLSVNSSEDWEKFKAFVENQKDAVG